jgi:hypothetical protein
MFAKQWWKEVTERMIKTGAQALITLIGTDVTGSNTSTTRSSHRQPC